MKRLLSLLVAIAMMVSLIPNVFAAKEEVDMDELLGRLVVLEDISLIEVKLAEGSDGMIYQWTPAADEEATELNLSWYPETAVLNVTATTGENTVSATTENNFGQLTLPIVAGQLVEIEVSEANGAAAEAYISGLLSGYPAGHESNPIILGMVMEATIEKAAWFKVQNFVGDLVINGQGAFNVIYNGETIAAVDGVATLSLNASMWDPALFQIDAAGAYTFSLSYPIGSMENPAALVIGENVADIKAGSQGYTYTWTATEEGTLKITMPAGQWSYVLNNLTSSKYGDEQTSDSDPVVNPAEIAVAAGDEIQLIVNTYDPEAPWAAPAGQLTIKAELVLPAPAITITKQPENIIAYNNESVALTVEAEGEGLTYQWYRQEPGNDNWNAFTSAASKTANFTFTAYKDNDGRAYKCVITDANGSSVETEVVTLSVCYIKSSTQTQYMKTAGEKKTYTVEYSRPEGAKYQWQVKYTTEDDSKWRTTSQTGAKTDTLTFGTTNLKDIYEIRCMITDADGVHVVYTEKARLLVDGGEATIKNATAGQLDVIQGYYTYMTVEAEGLGVKYDWFISTDGGETFYAVSSTAAAKTAELRVIAYAYRNGYQYKCRISTLKGADTYKVWTDVITLNILPAADIIEQPANAEAILGESVSFFVKAEMPECEIIQGTNQLGNGSSITYQWQRSKTGSFWNDIKGETGDTLTLEANETNAMYLYRCVITNDSQLSGGSIKSEPASLTIIAE